MTTTLSRPGVFVPSPVSQAVGTLCVFRGPTPWLDPARKLVTPIKYDLHMMADDGQKARFQEAGMVQRAVEDLGYLCDHDPAVQHSRDGIKVHRLREESPEERFLRRVPDPMSKLLPWESFARDPFADEPLAVQDEGYTLSLKPQGAWVSPSVWDEAGERLLPDAFPESFDWGNGVTCNSWVPLLRADGERVPVLVSWCVLPPEVAGRMSPADWRAMQRCFEGGQTGAILPEPAPPPPECPAVLENGDHWWKYIDHDIPHLRGCRVCGALRVGDRTVTIQANNIEVSTAAAPANPAAGLVRLYCTGDTNHEMRSSGGTVTGFVSGIIREGGNTTEATTTSTTRVDLLTVTTSIATGVPIQVNCLARKTTGAANSSSIGLKLNATSMRDPTVWSGSANSAENSFILSILQNGVTNYETNGIFTYGNIYIGTSTTVYHQQGQPGNVTITSVITTGLSGAAAITTGADEMQVYRFAVA